MGLGRPSCVSAVGATQGAFGRYRVVRPLGDGAMGTVYLATDDLLGREVAIKTLRPLAAGAFQAEVFRARFSNEARAVASLSHPSIVQVFDMGLEGRVPYLVMEVVHGPSLKARLAERGRLAPGEARALGVQMARALDEAHRRGIVHRDVKPANILEASGGTWKLADFGVAHVPDSDLTLTGQFIGSPAYGAPEAIERGELTPAGDVYGLGATLSEALAGTPDVPPDLARSIERAMAKDPGARPSARQLAEELAGQGDAVSRGARSRLVPIALGAAAVLALLVVLGLSSRREPATPAQRAPFSLASEPAVAGDTPVVPRPQSEKHAKHWRKVQEKLAKGDLEEAAKHLEEILEKHPDDAEARTLLERIRREPAPAYDRDD
jgi:eukaryotic-like serine/threonine-protein kinase